METDLQVSVYWNCMVQSLKRSFCFQSQHSFPTMFSIGPDHLLDFATKWTLIQKVITMEGQFTKEGIKIANKDVEEKVRDLKYTT